MWSIALVLSFMLHSGSDVYVVTNSRAHLSMADVHELFIGEKEFSGSLRLTPIDNAAVQPLFVAKALGMTPKRYETLWVKKTFRDALTPPPRVASDADVLAFVERTPGAVGYVSAPPASAAVTIVGKF